MSTTSADHHVQAVIDLLEAAADAEWPSDTPPDIYRYWDIAQSEKGPGADQVPHLYVWSPTSSPKERFSMDTDEYDRTDAIEIQVWSLDATEVKDYQLSTAAVLEGYLDDNKTETPYQTVDPVGENDFREQKTARRTEHYIMSVEVDLRGLDAVGVA
jgi:hypothetical protein